MNEKGHTLIEYIIAFSVFAMVSVGLMQGLNVGIWGTYRVSQRNMAISVARSQIEYVKNQDYQPCTDNPCTVTYSKLNESYLPPSFSLDDITIAVANISDDSAEDLQQISVAVTYDNIPVEMSGYNVNAILRMPYLRDLPIVETVEIAVPPLPGSDGQCPIRLDSGEFFVFYGYAHRIYVPREGAVAVTWIIDDDETYGSENRIDLYLYQHGVGGEYDGPFDDAFYDNRWDTTCYNCSVPYECPYDCRDAENWDGDPDPDLPRIVLMDAPNCWEEADPAQCHDIDLPQGWIAHDEVYYLQNENILTTVLTGNQTVSAGWYTIFFYNSNPVEHLDYLYTVASELASVSYYTMPDE